MRLDFQLHSTNPIHLIFRQSLALHNPIHMACSQALLNSDTFILNINKKLLPLKPRIKSTGKSWPTASKDGLGVNDVEYASGHEDDALFGDLFLEASRQVILISNGHE